MRNISAVQRPIPFTSVSSTMSVVVVQSAPGVGSSAAASRSDRRDRARRRPCACDESRGAQRSLVKREHAGGSSRGSRCGALGRRACHQPPPDRFRRLDRDLLPDDRPCKRGERVGAAVDGRRDGARMILASTLSPRTRWRVASSQYVGFSAAPAAVIPARAGQERAHVGAAAAEAGCRRSRIVRGKARRSILLGYRFRRGASCGGKMVHYAAPQGLPVNPELRK